MDERNRHRLADELESTESALLEHAVEARAAELGVLGGLLETQAHTLASIRHDLNPESVTEPGTLAAYLDREGVLELPQVPGEQGDVPEADDGDPIPDGGRSFAAQPETCPECGLTLDGNGECPTNGCPGPDGGGDA